LGRIELGNRRTTSRHEPVHDLGHFARSGYGKLKGYWQEIPHDAWDFDSSPGEFMMIDRGGKKYVVHPSKDGFVYVYDRNAKPQKVWPLVKNINFVKTIQDDGTLVGRRDLAEGKHENLCPAIMGGISWNAGSYNPRTRLFYKIGYDGA